MLLRGSAASLNTYAVGKNRGGGDRGLGIHCLISSEVKKRVWYCTKQYQESEEQKHQIMAKSEGMRRLQPPSQKGRRVESLYVGK